VYLRGKRRAASKPLGGQCANATMTRICWQFPEQQGTMGGDHPVK